MRCGIEQSRASKWRINAPPSSFPPPRTKESPVSAAPPATASRPLPLAFPRPGGRWAVHTATVRLSVTDWRLHAIELPGLGTRSGPGDGLSAIFYVVHGVAGEPNGRRRGAVVRWWVEDGKVARTETVADDVPLVG